MSQEESLAPLLIISCVVLVAIVSVLWWRPWKTRSHSGAIQVNSRTGIAKDDATIFAGYGGSASCRDCHPNEYQRWQDSHHGLAERKVFPSADKDAFDPPRVIHHGSQTSEALDEHGRFDVVTMGPDGKKSFEVQRVIGVDPLEQFLVHGPGGRMQTLELAFDPNKKDWFDVYGSEDRQVGEWGHWTGRGMTWNAMCAACHNTRLRKNYDGHADAYHTTMAEMSVACEACHGPMKSHAQWQQQYKNTKQKEPARHRPSADKILDTCGSCHARRGDLTGDFVPGDAFFDHYTLNGVDDTDLFYPDGQVRDEDYEFSAFLGSKMHAAGVRCTDCHDVHSGKTNLPGNALCMRCHLGTFPKAPIINPALHTFHKLDSTGSQCINCHMPVTTYMQRHGRHDHGFTIPDPLLTREAGIPNACNRCHKDKETDWALAAADKWYGKKLDRPSRSRALTIAAGRRGAESSQAALLALLNDSAQTFYWKSAFVRLLGRWVGEPAVTTALLKQTRHEHPMVRENATMALGPLAARPDVAKALAALLNDPSRNVRIAAAHALGASVDPSAPAAKEFLECLNQQADQPTGQLQLAMTAASRHDENGAIYHIEKALQWDPRSAPLRREAAVLYGQLNRPATALSQIEEACRLDPKNAEYQFLRGLAATEARHPEQAIIALEQAVRLDPHYARAWYNLAMMRQSTGQADAAMAAFRNAELADPKDADIPYALAVMLTQMNRPDEARKAVQRSLQIRPDYPAAKELLRNLGP